MRKIASALGRHPFRLASAIVVVAAGAYLAASPAWTSRQAALSLGSLPSRYSELFFTDITSLPVHSLPGVAHSVAFTIVNREGRAVRYRYVVTLDAGGATKVVTQRHVVVPNNEKVDLTAQFAPKGSNALYTVTIKINERRDSIEFHGHTT